MSARTAESLSLLKLKEKTLFQTVIGLGFLIAGSILTGVVLALTGFSSDSVSICFAVTFFASFAVIILSVLTAPNFH